MCHCVCLSVCLSVQICLSVHLSVRVCLTVCLSVPPSRYTLVTLLAMLARFSSYYGNSLTSKKTNLSFVATDKTNETSCDKCDSDVKLCASVKLSPVLICSLDSVLPEGGYVNVPGWHPKLHAPVRPAWFQYVPSPAGKIIRIPLCHLNLVICNVHCVVNIGVLDGSKTNLDKNKFKYFIRLSSFQKMKASKIWHIYQIK